MVHSKVASSEVLGLEKKRLQHNIVDVFPGIPTDPDKWSLHGEWTYTPHTQTHTHTHTHTHTYTHTQTSARTRNGNESDDSDNGDENYNENN